MKNPVTNVNAVISFEPAPEEYCRFSFVFLFFFSIEVADRFRSPSSPVESKKKEFGNVATTKRTTATATTKKKRRNDREIPHADQKKKTVHNPVRKKKLGKTTHAHTHTKWGMGRTIRCDYKCVSPENKKKERERERENKKDAEENGKKDEKLET